MKPEFSETTYGFALVNEIASGLLGNLRVAPIFPSLNAEGGDAGLGYDVKLEIAGYLLYLQFKVTHFMTGGTAAERHLWNDDYYRMQLYSSKKSYQHQLLMDLERSGEEVYYVAPAFHTEPSLHAAFQRRRVSAASAFFRPIDIGKFGRGTTHRVVFTPTSKFGYVCSEPRRLDEVIRGELFAAHARQKAQAAHVLRRNDYFNGAVKLLRLLDRGQVNDPLFDETVSETLIAEWSTSRLAGLMAHLSRRYWGANLFIVGD